MSRRRAEGPTVTITIRLRRAEKDYLQLAARQEAEEISTMLMGVSTSVAKFVRWAALQKAEQRLGYSVADHVKGPRRRPRIAAAAGKRATRTRGLPGSSRQRRRARP